MKILAKIRYNGKNYCGFQCQRNGIAVQNVLTDAAEKVYGEKCLVTGCSRTDAGVHALGFCITVEPADKSSDCLSRIPAGKIHRAFSKQLPEDIAVTEAAAVPDSFHPRYSAVGKNYIYRISDAPFDDPFENGRSFHCTCRIDREKEEKMRLAAKGFEGRHDFTSFMAQGSKITDAVRTVTETEIYRGTDGVLVFSVSADGFLYNMVRIMAGTLVDVARGRIAPRDTARIIDARDRRMAGFTAPACGLYLKNVFYNTEIKWECE